MRLVTLMIVLTLLTVGMPAVADQAEEEENRWSGTINVTDNVHLQAGWWGGSGVSYNQDNGLTDDHDPVWITIQVPTNLDEGDDVQLRINASGDLIGAVDVFEIQDTDSNHVSYTPNCPQDAVYELYPEQDQPILSYVAGLPGLSPTSDDQAPMSQRVSGVLGDNSTTIDLSLGEDVDIGYIAAIYPQIALGDEQDPARLEWDVSVDGKLVDTKEHDVHGGLQHSGPTTDQPVDLSEWIEPLSPSTYFECPNEGFALPGIIPLPDELPTSTSQSITPTDLLDASLPGPSIGQSDTADSVDFSSLTVPQSHGGEDTDRCLHGDVADTYKTTGFIQLSNQHGETATVTEVTNFILFPQVTDAAAPVYDVIGQDVDPDWTMQGVDAWIWSLGCETNNHTDEEFCIEDREPQDNEDIATLHFDTEPTFGLKFYGETLQDFEGYRSLESGECLVGGTGGDIPTGAENIVIFVEEGDPSGTYFDSDFRKPPAGVYTSHFCAIYGSMVDNPDCA